MSFNQSSPESQEEESSSTQISDEKMDTGTESIPSTHDTPNSQISLDFEYPDQPGPNSHLQYNPNIPNSNTKVNSDENNSTETNKKTYGSNEKYSALFEHNFDDRSLESNGLVHENDYNSDPGTKSNGLNHKEQTEPSVLRLAKPNAENYIDYRENSDEESETDSPKIMNASNVLNYGRISLCMDKDLRNDANLKQNHSLNDSLIDQMSQLNIATSKHSKANSNINRPLCLGVSPPQISSTLTATSDHPLMSVSSPESPLDNHYTDFCHHGPQRNTSKNNLYFSESFSTVDGNLLTDTNIKFGLENFETSSPNMNHKEPQLSVSANLRNGIFQTNRRKIIPCFHDSADVKKKEVGLVIPQRVLGREIVQNVPSKDVIAKYIEERNRKIPSDADKVIDNSITNSELNNDRSFQADLSLVLDDDSTFQEFDSGPVDFPDSPSMMRRKCNFVLPVELPTNITTDELISPNLSTCSTEKDLSQYCAVVDPVCGQASLHNTLNTNTSRQNTSSCKRRRIKVHMESMPEPNSPSTFPEPVMSRSESLSEVVDRLSLNSEQVWKREHSHKVSDTDTQHVLGHEHGHKVSDIETEHVWGREHEHKVSDIETEHVWGREHEHKVSDIETEHVWGREHEQKFSDIETEQVWGRKHERKVSDTDTEQVWEREHERKDSYSDTEEYSKRDLEVSRSESLTSEYIPEYSAEEERSENRHWMKVQLAGGEYQTIDMKVIEPFKRVISHGGYTTQNEAIIVFSACFLPHNGRVDYHYVMDNLFVYVLSTLENLVTDNYILVYLHGSAEGHKLPTFHWLRKCYQLVDRRLRKSLKKLYLVHPTLWLKTLVVMCRPFMSSKITQKLNYVNSLKELCTRVPVEGAAIPDSVRIFDAKCRK